MSHIYLLNRLTCSLFIKRFILSSSLLSTNVGINTESGDVIHIVHMVSHKMKEFVDFNSRNSVKSQCMGKYSIINTINKKVLGHITTCLQSKVWGWALRWTGSVYINISSKWGMGVSKIVGPSTAKYGICN